MKYKTLFRVLLKAIGVLLFAQGCSQFINYIFAMALQLMQGMGPSIGWMIGGFFAANAQIAIGVYLFFGGKWLVDKAIPGNRPYCHECGYDLTGLPRNRCPECDTPFKPDEVKPSELLNPTDESA